MSIDAYRNVLIKILRREMPSNQRRAKIDFWAKITAEGKPGISVRNHMINVGYVARCIAENSPLPINRFSLSPSVVAALAALHDIGKISPGFQCKCYAWLEQNGLDKIAQNNFWNRDMESDHGKISHAVIQSFLNKQGVDKTTAKFVSTVLAAHHGRLTRPTDRVCQSSGMSEVNSTIEWEIERERNAYEIWEHFVKDYNSFSFSESSPELWWLAGLTSVADWIGSNERFFPACEDVSVNPYDTALQALNSIGFGSLKLKQNLSFHDLFHDADNPEVQWLPNDIQEKTYDKVTEPGVYIIEAPMGSGKTEAALWAAYRLLVSEQATGIYFALPTQSTSNRMHLRMGEFVRRICKESNLTRLIHGNSWLMDRTCTLSPVPTIQGSPDEDARKGQDWFASTKRALLSPFGVGTVDQALLGVVAAKHFFVRQFALAGKVVILDEIHSYDIYTGTLIDRLIEVVEKLGCTVIVLSATLSGKRREKIVHISENNNVESFGCPYPLITGRQTGISFEPVAAEYQDSQTTKVEFVKEERSTEKAIQTALNGGAVLWICDTVDTAQKQYRKFTELAGKQFPTGLLHSRFPFWRREALENEWMMRFGKEGVGRCGSILVSTQICEQSVDLDADFLITELAPTDMLLQRLGRLWRHKRPCRPVDSPRMCVIEEKSSIEELRNMESKMLKQSLGQKAYIYAPYILLRSLEVWKSLEQVVVPLEIRKLIELTYQEKEDEPDSWQELSNDWFGTDSARKMLANRNTNPWTVALEDEEGVQTRINEMLTVSLVLCREVNHKEVSFLDDSTGDFGTHKFQLSLAQSIHKNTVKIPAYCFNDFEECPIFGGYLRGKGTIGVVNEDGMIKVEGLRDEIELCYYNDTGLVINKKQECP